MNFAQLLLPDFSLILIGYLVCRFTPLGRPVWAQAEMLVYYFLFPVLLFHSIARSPLDLGSASSLIAAGLMLCVAAIALAHALPHLPGLARRIEPASTRPRRRSRSASTRSSCWRWRSGSKARAACC